MLRALIAYLLIVTVLTANLSRCFLFAAFSLNQKYIAAKLCENRDKPVLNCKGKCYLAKKIKQAEEKEKNQERQSQKNNFQEALMTRKVSLIAPVPQIVHTSFFELPFSLSNRSSDFFQPPRV